MAKCDLRPAGGGAGGVVAGGRDPGQPIAGQARRGQRARPGQPSRPPGRGRLAVTDATPTPLPECLQLLYTVNITASAALQAPAGGF